MNYRNIALLLLALLVITSVATNLIMNHEFFLGSIAVFFIISYLQTNTYKKIWNIDELSKRWMYFLLIFIVLSIISLVQHLPWGSVSYRLMTINASILLYIPILYMLKRINFEASLFWKYMILTGFSSLLVIIYEIFVLNISIDSRIGQIVSGNPIDFGIYCATISIVLLCGIKWVLAHNNKITSILFGLSFFSAIAGMLFSGSRTAWLGFLISLIFYSLYQTIIMVRRGAFKRRRSLYSALIMFIIVTISVCYYFLEINNNNLFGKRIEQAIHSYKTYKQNKLHPSSLSVRLIIFESGINMIKGAPWIGVGDDKFKDIFSKTSKTVQKDRFKGEYETYYYTQLHNQYLMLFATRGLLGLFLSVLVLCFMIFQFGRYLFLYESPLALSGCLVTIMYAVFFFFTTPFYWANEQNFFFLIPTLLIAALDNSKTKQQVDNPFEKKLN